MIELDDWILAVNVEEHEKMVGSIERVMVDSGAAVSVCPLGYAPEIPMTNHSRRATLRTATGAQIEHAGQKTVEYENSEGGSECQFRGRGRDKAVGGGWRVTEARNDCGDGPTWKLRDSRPRNETAWQQSGFGALERCLLVVSDERGKRHEYCGPCRPGGCRAHQKT